MSSYPYLSLLPALLIVSTSFPCLCLSQSDVIPCSGKIKSDYKIDYSKINVNVYTRSGSLVESSDCAPNNGYFVVPIYEKGDYLIKLAPPTGWSFEPSEVSVSIDGVTDQCSLKKDIVFVFSGFTVTGQVNSHSHGGTGGPRGVRISVKGLEILRETETLDGGVFQLAGILPGEYSLAGSHPVWTISQSPVSITVSNGIVEVPDGSVVVEGYDVKGTINSKGEPVAEVLFLLYSQDKSNDKLKVACGTGSDVPSSIDNIAPPLCVVMSSNVGVFIFQSLPPGEYKMVPRYQSEESTYQVSPSETFFSVTNDSVIVKPSFEVQGFSVYGSVLLKEGGEGVAGASVRVDGSVLATTDSQGRYQLVNVTAGTYNIEVTASNVEFEPLVITLSPSAPRISTIVPARYSLCGEVEISVHPLKHKFETGSCSVQVNPHSSTSQVDSVPIAVGSDGRFCVMLTPGQYNVQITVNSDAAAEGLSFTDSTVHVTVEAGSINQSPVLFKQLTRDLTVTVKCIAACQSVDVTLMRQSNDQKQVQSAKATNPSNAEATFNQLLPGVYKVSISSDQDDAVCWSQEEQTVTVPLTGETTPISFTQSGFKLKIQSTHNTDVQLVKDNAIESAEIIKVVKGHNTFCLERGDYSLIPKSCYSFTGDLYMFLTSMPSPIEMVAVSHEVTGTVLAPNDSSVPVKVTFSNTKTQRKDKELKSYDKGASDNQFIYRYSFKAKPGTVATVTPHPTNLICQPDSRKFTVGEDCPESVPDINCREGIFIEGRIDPPLVGVVITVSVDNDQQFNIVTDDNGVYRAGPLPPGSTHTVEATLDHYVFHPLSEDDSYNFRAVKVSGIVIKMLNTGGSPLTEGLVSMSGAEFRSTDGVTQEGTVTHRNLQPGEYYVKPILREYEFTPPSKVITLDQGEDLSVVFTGKRTAFSVTGKVMSLNRTPLQGALIEVESDGEKCHSFRETTTSDDNGQYRFRGIMPSCSYYISVVTSNADSIVEVAMPTKRYIQISDDVIGEDFMVTLKPSQTIVTGDVTTPTPEHLQTLRIVVYADKYLESVLYTTTPDPMGFFSITLKHSPPPVCYVKVETSLSHHYYSIETNTTSFSTTESDRHITLYFSAKPGNTVGESSSRGSFVGILVAVAAMFVCINYEKILTLVPRPAGLTNKKTKRR